MHDETLSAVNSRFFCFSLWLKYRMALNFCRFPLLFRKPLSREEDKRSNSHLPPGEGGTHKIN